MLEPALLYRDETVLVGRAGVVFLNVWKNGPSAATMGRVWEAQKQMGGPHVVMTIVARLPARARLDAEARNLSEQIGSDVSLGVRRNASVIEATGFVGAAARAIITSFDLVSRRPYETKVFGNVKASVDWLAPVAQEIDPGFDVVAVVDAVARLRAP